MKINRFMIALAVVFLLLNVSAFASEKLSAKPEFTFDGLSLAEYANIEEQPDIVGYSAYALNLNTGMVVYQKNSRDIVYPASTTKLMTAIVAYENIPDLDVKITATEYVVRNTQGANVRIEAGEIYTARELLNAGYQNKKLEAIKIVRERTGLGLAEAKDVVDAELFPILQKEGCSSQRGAVDGLAFLVTEEGLHCQDDELRLFRSPVPPAGVQIVQEPPGGCPNIQAAEGVVYRPGRVVQDQLFIWLHGKSP